MNNAKRLKSLTKELAKSTEKIAKQTGLSFDTVLELSINVHREQNPNISQSYFQYMRQLVKEQRLRSSERR